MAVDLSAHGQPMDVSATARRAFPTYTGPTSYAAGGESGLAEACRLGFLYAVVGAIISNGTTVLFGYYNHATEKLQWFDAAGVEASGNLSAYSGTFEVIGR